MRLIRSSIACSTWVVVALLSSPAARAERASCVYQDDASAVSPSSAVFLPGAPADRFGTTCAREMGGEFVNGELASVGVALVKCAGESKFTAQTCKLVGGQLPGATACANDRVYEAVGESASDAADQLVVRRRGAVSDDASMCVSIARAGTGRTSAACRTSHGKCPSADECLADSCWKVSTAGRQLASH